MAAKTKTVAEKPAGLTAAQRAPIVKAWASGVQTLGNIGGELVERIVTVARNTLEASYEITTEDSHALSADAARITHWKRDKHGKYSSRASEIKTFLAARAKLVPAIKALRAEIDACTWNDSLALAKALNAGKSVEGAVRAVKASRKAKGASEPADSDKAKAQAAGRIKPMLTWSKLPRDFKAQLRQLCAEYNIKV